MILFFTSVRFNFRVFQALAIVCLAIALAIVCSELKEETKLGFSTVRCNMIQ